MKLNYRKVASLIMYAIIMIIWFSLTLTLVGAVNDWLVTVGALSLVIWIIEMIHIVVVVINTKMYKIFEKGKK